MNVQPYLFFDGSCEQALNFYAKAIGAKTEMMMRFKDSPDTKMCTPDNKEKIMHVCLKVGDTAIFASDGMNKGKPNFDGFSLSLNAKDEAEAEKLFKALGEGGAVTMPLAETFFAKRFGMLKDQFGVNWMVLAPKQM
ncbi:MAG: VOC family protein [Pseudolabrys sp.]